MPKRTLLCALLVATACGESGRPIPDSVRARLESILDLGRKEPTPDEIRDALTQQLQRAGSESAPFPSPETIHDFYAKRGNRLIWTDAAGRLGNDAVSLLRVLHGAGEDGLDPDDYGVSRLEALEQEMRERPKGAGAAQRIADFDLLGTAALFRFASDLATGRVHPGEVESDWHTKTTDLDVAGILRDAIERHDLAGALATLRPPQRGYARLREALAKLREERAWPTVPPGRKLARGAVGPRVGRLRARLGMPSSPRRFDRLLEGRVRRFQMLHGIEPDGVVGKATLEALNVSIDERIGQLELNLERWRWIPRDLGDPHVLVNIAGFDLTLERRGADAWRTRVVAGKAFTPTPVFSDRIVAVVINPRWNVPESIAVNEYLPKLQKNRRALAKEDVRVFQGAGDKEREVNPERIDWTRVDPGHFPYMFRQDPGGKNPLGRLKFDLTNGYHVYLHDTPAGAVFGRADRGRSHGCIRVEDAKALAAQITDDDGKEKILKALAQDEERRIELRQRTPVHIFYWTAWVDDRQNLHFVPDVYALDQPQQAALQKVSGRTDRRMLAHFRSKDP